MLLCSLASCNLLQVKEGVDTIQHSTVLVGIITSTLPDEDMPVVVTAYTKKNNIRTIVHYTTLHEPGPYELMVPMGTYNVVAFGDANRNLIYDQGEPVGQILDVKQLSASPGGVIGNLDIVIMEQSSIEIDIPVGFTLPPKKYSGFHSTCPGAVADLDDYVFSDEYGEKGLWTGLEFFREIGGNIFFLEEYSPEKIPILFIHGAAGSPQNWKTFYRSIDRDTFQPWFFYYPSGSSLDAMSHLLLWKLQNLKAKYKFKELIIAAHSMGGLVARSFIVNYGSLFPALTGFISISTPWGGEELAEMGVKFSPAVIPAWRDMQPDSEFIQSIFSKKIPPTIDYYLFFGHKGNRNILRPNNDNAVTLASQLDLRSQNEAKMIYGFDEDHVSILNSDQVMSQFNAILGEMYHKSRTLNTIPGNRLYVDFSFDFPEELPKPISALYLRPINEEESGIWIYISPEDTGREFGPFPSGEYEASIIASAFAPEPVSVPVTINDRSVPKVKFTMKPQGYIRGYLAKSDQEYLQAGETPQPDSDIEIQSVILRGDDFERTILPGLGKQNVRSETFPERYLSKSDFLSEGTFFFFDVPDGKYELILHAKGYKPYSEMCEVRQGQYQNTIVIELDQKAVTAR